MINLMPMAVCACDAPSGVITFYNDHAAELWGRTPCPGDTDERYCGSFMLWWLDGSPLRHDQSPMAFALKEGRGFRNLHLAIERPDGSRIVVLVNIDPIRDESGAVIGAINAFHDVTALRETERAIREGHARREW
jgi:PAS domain-containing protein